MPRNRLALRPLELSPQELLFFEHSRPGSKHRLLTAAVEAFAEKGFHGTSTRNIAQKAGMSPAAVYLHYKTKEEVLYEICSITSRAAVAALRAATGKASAPDQRLVAVMVAVVEFHAVMHTATRVANYELRALNPTHLREILALRTAAERIIEDCLRRGVKSGNFEIENLQAVRTAILSLAISVSRWYSPAGPMTPAEVGKLYGGFVLRLVRSSTPDAKADGDASRPRPLLSPAPGAVPARKNGKQAPAMTAQTVAERRRR